MLRFSNYCKSPPRSTLSNAGTLTYTGTNLFFGPASGPAVVRVVDSARSVYHGRLGPADIRFPDKLPRLPLSGCTPLR